MRRARTVIAACLAALLWCAGVAAAQRAQRITNPGFERAAGERAEGWAPYESGYALDRAARRGGGASIRCSNSGPDERRGATWTLELAQIAPAPLLVTGWSRSEGVSGAPDLDYAIYVDLEYMDGTPLWAQVAPFPTGTHDWVRRQVLVVPSKPIRRAWIHALFRRHTGTVWFDDFDARALPSDGVFDGQLLAAPRLPAGQRAGWFARDVAADGPVLPIADARGRPAGGAGRLGLRLTGYVESAAGRIGRTTLADTTGRDRAVTLYYVERLDGPRPIWWQDIRRGQPAGSAGEWANLTAVNVGATGFLSLYPFGCVTVGRTGRCLGIPPLLGPRVARIAYHAPARLFYVAFDLALTPRAARCTDGRGHGTASVAVARFNVDPAWGFRDAAARYYALFSDAFDRRATQEGIWIPFTDPATVRGHEDFGFAYHEGDNSVASDDRLGILSFRYTEPMTWWMAMPPAAPRTYEEALAEVDTHRRGSSEEMRRWAQALHTSGVRGPDGRFDVAFVNAPWTNGAVWTLNPNPDLPHAPEEWTKGRLAFGPEAIDRGYGPGAAGRLDGEYLDSLEGWADVLDYGDLSLRWSTIPPSFARDTRRPVIPTWFSAYELARRMRGGLRAAGRLLMANGTPWRFHAFVPLLDVAGTETNWLPDGSWRPDSDEVFCLRRTLCFRKPYLLLMNTDFDRFGRDLVERYMRVCTAYAVFPGMFSVDASNHPYWGEPRWYERDRALFKRYIPLIARLSRAGWEPLTYARASGGALRVERFGREYVTVLNATGEAASARLSVDCARIRGRERGDRTAVEDALTGEVIGRAGKGGEAAMAVTVEPWDVRVLRLADAGPAPR
ncbi:MAG: hypothetical protein IT208_04515 [Chthonomonadales bacterium]|nr:hypothetical protein [Chthonomonadales bacterium]